MRKRQLRLFFKKTTLTIREVNVLNNLLKRLAHSYDHKSIYSVHLNAFGLQNKNLRFSLFCCVLVTMSGVTKL